MKKNVGGEDRLARLITGPILIVVGIASYAGVISVSIGPLSQTLTAIVVGVFGAGFAATGLVEKCPINRALGFNSYHASHPTESDTTE